MKLDLGESLWASLRARLMVSLGDSLWARLMGSLMEVLDET